jgi:hypothetical protein
MTVSANAVCANAVSAKVVSANAVSAKVVSANTVSANAVSANAVSLTFHYSHSTYILTLWLWAAYRSKCKDTSAVTL